MFDPSIQIRAASDPSRDDSGSWCCSGECGRGTDLPLGPG